MILQKIWEENSRTKAAVHLIEGTHLICGPLDTSFTEYWTGIYLKGAHRSRIYYATAACFTLRLDLWKLLGLLLRNFLRTFHRWIGSLAKVLEMCSILEILLPQYQASPSLLRCRYNAQPESIKTLTGCRTGKSWKKVAGPGKFWKSIKLN